MGCLYQLTFPSGKSYIGITLCSLDKRIGEHLSHSRKNNGYAVHNAIRKYGENFECKTLVIADDCDYLKNLEIKAIEAYDTFAPKGYNLTKGGDGVFGLIASEETRKKISASLIGNSNTLGYKHTEETKRNMSLSATGRVFSAETIKKFSDAKKGKKKSAETKARMSIAKKNRPPMSQETKDKIGIAGKGRVQSKDTYDKLSAIRKGMRWFNNGEKNTKARECPDGFVIGQIRFKSRI